MNIEIDDEEINVEEIMKQIKSKVASKKYEHDLLAGINKKSKGSSFNTSSLEEFQLLLNRTWNTSIYQPISSHRKFLGPFIVLYKKVVRKMLFWYIHPIIERQTEFNANVVRAYNELLDQLKHLENYYQEEQSTSREGKAE